jgi:hypothetical protein
MTDKTMRRNSLQEWQQSVPNRLVTILIILIRNKFVKKNDWILFFFYKKKILSKISKN